MCGICGVFPQTELTQLLLPMMAWDIEDRGNQSWGAMCKDGVLVKKLGRITESMEIFPSCESVVYHTRQASTGAVTVENTHPFVFKGEKEIVGVHNGVISNHTTLNDRYNRDFDVDSMHLFAHLAEGRDLKDVGVWGAMVWYENGVLKLAKLSSNGAMHVVKLKTGEYVFASESSTLAKATALAGAEISLIMEVNANKVYRFEMDNGVAKMYVEDGVFETLSSGGTGWTYPTGGYRGSQAWDNDGYDGWYGKGMTCRNCSTASIDTRTQVVCKKCLDKIRHECTLRRSEPVIVSGKQAIAEYVKVN